jgi:hypothetical protein
MKIIELWPLAVVSIGLRPLNVSWLMYSPARLPARPYVLLRSGRQYRWAPAGAYPFAVSFTATKLSDGGVRRQLATAKRLI